ncbi:MAG TPA: hypothetical protein VNM48_19560 [Chloroflexota bacterium]|nr:hypothetical protein [Chloroflexota bacterium]
MTDPSRSPDAGDIAGLAPSRTSTTSYPGMPRWVKLSGIVVLVLVLLVAGVMAVAGGQHGPMRHTPSGAPGGDTLPTAQVMQQVMQQAQYA